MCFNEKRNIYVVYCKRFSSDTLDRTDSKIHFLTPVCVSLTWQSCYCSFGVIFLSKGQYDAQGSHMFPGHCWGPIAQPLLQPVLYPSHCWDSPRYSLCCTQAIAGTTPGTTCVVPRPTTCSTQPKKERERLAGDGVDAPSGCMSTAAWTPFKCRRQWGTETVSGEVRRGGTRWGGVGGEGGLGGWGRIFQPLTILGTELRR